MAATLWSEELALPNHRLGLDERHRFGHEVRGRNRPVQTDARTLRRCAWPSRAGSDPPGRNRSAMIAPTARSPLTVTDADDGENGPGSASDKLVARYVGKRGSIGVSNSPLPPSGPANTGATPSAAGVSTAGMSWTWVSRHGSDVDHLPTLTRPRTANATSWTHSCRGPGRCEIPFVAQQCGIHRRRTQQ